MFAGTLWQTGESVKTAAAKKPPAKETHFEALKRLGLIGCIKGGPRDLARNRRKYLRRALRAKYAR
jgi:hypothetical protein